MKTLEIYGRDIDGQPCIWCRRAKELLEKRAIPFEYLDMTGNAELEAEFVTRTNGAKTVPQIFVGIQRIGGFTDLARADATGVLQQMIQE